MRLLHLIFVIFVIALLLTIAREPAGRVAVIVFVIGLGEVALGTMALLALFQTLGAIGEADTLFSHAEAVVATTLVLAVGSSTMAGLLVAGIRLVSLAVA